jgi:hypothetical protein
LVSVLRRAEALLRQKGVAEIELIDVASTPGTRWTGGEDRRAPCRRLHRDTYVGVATISTR